MLRFVGLLLTTSLTVALPGRAAAETPEPVQRPPEAPADTSSSSCDAEPVVCGRRAFDEGVVAYGKEDFSTAIAKFEEALRYKWHPAIALNLALADSKAGHYLDALRELDAITAAPSTPRSIADQAQRERTHAEGELAFIEVEVGAEGATTVALDGTHTDARTPLRADPGPHVLEVTLPSGAVIRRNVTLQARERLHVAIDRTHEIVIAPARERVAPAPNRTTTDADHGATRPGLSPVWFYAGAGVTGVLGGFALWSALDTRSAYDDYRKRVPVASQSELDARVGDGHDKEARTNILLAATGVAAAGTAALAIFAVEFRGSQKAALVVSPNGAAVQGRF